MLIAHGSPCERIAWGRFKGPVTNIFVIGVHMPQSARKNPAQHNTLSVLRGLLTTVPSSDCIIVMGDLNVQLAACIQGVTDKWVHSSTSKNAQSMIDTMRMFELVAANTMYQPKKKMSNATFVQNVSKNKETSTASAANPNSEQTTLLGRSLSVNYKGKKCKGGIGYKPREWQYSANKQVRLRTKLKCNRLNTRAIAQVCRKKQTV